MKRILLILIIALSWQAFAAPQRIISLGADVTEIAAALGAAPQIVGRDSTSHYPEVIKKIPSVGYLRQLSAEGILALRPTLVLASSDAGPPLVLQQLLASGVKIATIPAPKTLADIPAKVTVIAAALNLKPAGEKLAAKLAQDIATLPNKPLNKRVLFVMSHGGVSISTAGPDTPADDAIRAAGLENAMQGFLRYPALSQEGVIQSQPDLILISRDAVTTLGDAERVWTLPAFALTLAGTNHQLMVIDDAALLSFGPRAPAIVHALREKAAQLP